MLLVIFLCPYTVLLSHLSTSLSKTCTCKIVKAFNLGRSYVLMVCLGQCLLNIWSGAPLMQIKVFEASQPMKMA